MVDFRDSLIEPGDVIAYVGRQDLKASLNEAKVVRIDNVRERLVVRPTRSSSPLGPPTGRLVTLTVLRKVVVIRKKRRAPTVNRSIS